MSTEAQNQVQLPDIDTAASILFDRARGAAFFNKLASLGYSPNSEDEAIEYLKLAARAREIEPQLKKAGAEGSLVKRANAALDSVMGTSPREGQDHHKEVMKVASAMVEQDPDLFNAVLTLKSAEADLHMEQVQKGLKG